MRVIGALAGLAAGLAVVSACASDTATIDGAKLERNIQADASGTGPAVRSVACPRDRPVAVDDRFTCTATLADGASLRYEVQISSAQGDYTYALAPDQTVDGAAVAAAVTADIASSGAPYADARVTCPSSILAPGGTAAFDCKVVIGGQSAVLRVTHVAGRPPAWTFT